MNNSYFASPMNNYSTSYDYSFEYSSPSTSTYYYSPLLQPSCPVHSSNFMYSSSPSMNISPLSYNYQQQSQVYSPPPPPPVQQRTY